jgi:membrane fusion protein, heavy metal efflux system
MVYSAVGGAHRSWRLPAICVLAVAAPLLTWLVLRFGPSIAWQRSERPAAEASATGPHTLAPSGAVRVQSGSLRAAGIEVESVRSVSMDNSISCQGSVGFNSNKYVEVPPKADGILRKINVDVGSRVRAGDVLAVVNSDVLGELKASFIKGMVHEEHLKWQVESLSAAGKGIPAKALFEAKHLLIEQQTDSAHIRYRLRYFGFTDDQIARITETQDPSVELDVLAPIDGTVVRRTAVEGEPIQATTSLFAVANLETMWATLSVYEHDLLHIRLGQALTFFPDGLAGQGFPGKVTWISPELNQSTRRVQLRAELDNREGALRANMFGRGQIDVEQPRECLVVPQSAVQSHDGKHLVFVQKSPDTFEPRAIELGRKDAEVWEVTAGLSTGEKVATTGSFLLKSNLENPEFGQVE